MWRHKSTKQNTKSAKQNTKGAKQMERKDSGPKNICAFCVLLCAFCVLLPLDQLSYRTLLPPVYASDDGPQFRGPEGTGHSDARDLPLNWSETNNVVWKTPIHDRGWSSPVIYGDQIWLTTATLDGRKLYAVCVSRETGRVIQDMKLF